MVLSYFSVLLHRYMWSKKENCNLNIWLGIWAKRERPKQRGIGRGNEKKILRWIRKLRNLVGRRRRICTESNRKTCRARGPLLPHCRPCVRFCRTYWGTKRWRGSWRWEPSRVLGWRAWGRRPSRPSCRPASWWTLCNCINSTLQHSVRSATLWFILIRRDFVRRPERQYVPEQMDTLSIA